MNHRTGLDLPETLLFPERLEDYIAPENPVRFLDAFVASLDLAKLEFAKARCATTGTPPYDPAMLLKLYLYGYLHRLRSSRLLEVECQRNVEVDLADRQTGPRPQNHRQFPQGQPQTLPGRPPPVPAPVPETGPLWRPARRRGWHQTGRPQQQGRQLQ